MLEINEHVGCKQLAKLQSALDRGNVWNMETTADISLLNVAWINVLSWLGRLAELNISSQFLGNYHPGRKIKPEYGITEFLS